MASTFAVMAKLTANTQNFDAGMEKASKSVEKIDKAAQKTSDKAGKTFSALGKGVLGVFAATAAAVGGVLAKGVGRLTQIEEAQAKLTGLGNTTESVASIMDNALSAVRGTAFGMGEAATIAASAVAAGVKPGQELSKYLKTVADTAYIAGASMEEMGYVLNQTITSGRATNDTLQSLAGRGIPIYQMLGEQFGVTGEAIFDMASKGQISADMLQQALNEKIGGAALKSGETVQGAFANMNAAFQRVGANIAGPVYNQFQEFFSNVITAMGPLEDRAKAMGTEIGDALEPVMESLIDVVMPLIELVFDLIAPLLKLIDAFKPLFDVVKPVADLFGEILKRLLPPLVKVIGIVAKVVADLIMAFLPLIEKILPVLVNWFENWIVPLIDMVARVITELLIPAFSYLAGTILDTVMPVVNGLVQVFIDHVLPVFETLVNFAIEHLPKLGKIFQQVFEAIGKAVMWVWDNILSPVFGWIADFLDIDLSGIGESFTKGFNNAKIDTFEEVTTEAKFTVPAAQTLGMEVGTALGTSLGNATSKAVEKTDPFGDFIAGLEESIRKVSARVQLESMGLSEGLVEAILGASDWEAVFKQIISGTEKTIETVKRLYRLSEAGLQELADAVSFLDERVAQAASRVQELESELAAFEESAKSFAQNMREILKDANPFAEMLDTRGEFEKQVTGTFTNFYEEISRGVKDGLFSKKVAEELSLLTATYETQLSTIAQRVDAINTELEDLQAIQAATRAYQEGMRDILDSTLPLAIAEREIGQFEQQVISSFDAVNRKIEDGLNLGLFSEQVAFQLRNTANQTRTTLSAIARQRDMLATTYAELVDKLNASRDFRRATKDALMGVANITTIGKSARTMIKNLSKTVERTNRFRDQLSTLQQLGLNREAYNQIVNSGLDAGSATAKAILRGGPEAVQQINNLFTQLEVEADALASEAESFMFDGGETAIQGFLDGIISQDEALRQVAEAEATAFNTIFKNTIDSAQVNLDSTIKQLEGEKDRLVNSATTLATAFAQAFQTTVDKGIKATQQRLSDSVNRAREAFMRAEDARFAADEAYAAALAEASNQATTTTTVAKTVTSTTPTTPKIVLDPKPVVLPTRVDTTTLAGVLAASGQSINITVNAGLGTNGAKVGQDVVKVVEQYTRTSGGGTPIRYL